MRNYLRLVLGLVLGIAPALVSIDNAWAATKWTLSDHVIPIQGDGGWDYVAIYKNHLFLTHTNRVAVIDLTSKTEIASIPAVGPHGVAIAPDLKRGFISNGKAGTVTIFDLDTLKPISEVKARQNPDAICYEPVTHRVFAFNGRSNVASVFDAATGNFLREIALDGKPEFAAVDGKGFVYNNLEDKSKVLKIDAVSGEIKDRWSLPPGSDPSALSIDPKLGLLFVGCGNSTLCVVDSGSGKVLQTLPIGKGVDADWYENHLVLVSCGEGVLNVFEVGADGKLTPSATVITKKGARTLAFDGRTAYLPTADFGPAPAATPEQPHPRPTILPGSVKLLMVVKE